MNIDSILKEKGMNKTVLANKMNISRDSLYSILNGNPTLENLIKLSDALGVTIIELFERRGNVEYLIRYKGEIYRIPESKIIKLIENGEAILIK